MSELEFRAIPNDELALYEPVSGEHPQAALHLDLHTGIVSFIQVYSGEDALTLDEAEDDNEYLQWPVEPLLKRNALAVLYEKAKPLIEQVFDAFEWDGNTATITAEGRKVYDVLARMFVSEGAESTNLWRIWDATTWFTASGSIEDAAKDVIKAETIDAAIKALVEKLDAEAYAQGIWITNTKNLTRELTELRDTLRGSEAA